MDTTRLIEKSRKPLLIAVVILLIYALIGFVVLPKVLQSKLPELIKTETGREASLERVEFNPFTLELSLQGFAMQEQDLQTFVSFSELFANVQFWSSLRQLALVLDVAKLTGPYVRLELLKGQQYNFSDLSSNEPAEQAEESNDSGAMFPIIFNKINLVQGKFELVNSLGDEFAATLIQNINIQLVQFSTLPNEDADLGFSMVFDGGGRLDWNGEFGINPVFSKGRIMLDGLDYPNLWQLFLQDLVPFEWVNGSQLIAFNYILSYPQDQLSLKISEGRLVTKELEFITRKDKKEFLKVADLSVEGITFDLNEQRLEIEKIESKDNVLQLWHEQSGQLNFQTVFTVSGGELDAEVEKQEQSTASQPWHINIQEIGVNAAIHYTDSRHKDTVLLDIAAVNLGVKNTHLTLDESFQIIANQGSFNLQGLVLQTDAHAELVKIPTLQVSDVAFNLQDKNIKIKSLNSRDAVIKSWLQKNGDFNYQTLFTSEASDQPPQVAEEKAEASWVFELDALTIENYALQFKDHTTATPVSLNLSEFNFSLTDYNNHPGSRIPLTFSTRFNQGGKIKLSGHSVLEPFKAELDVAINKIGVDSFEPYINQSARLDIIGGDFNTNGKLAISQAKHKELELNYRGNISIKGLHTRDQILNQDFLKWRDLKLSGFDFNLQPGRLKIKSILLDQPYARVTIKKDKTTNIQDVIVAADKAGKSSQVKQQAAPSSFAYTIDKFNITQGESDFSDYSLILPFVVKLNALTGDVSRISSNQKTKTKVDLKGRVFDLSPVEVQGEMDAKLDEADITMHFKSFPLPFISPYMVEFSGDKIEKGKMSLDLRYQVSNKELTATNNLVIDQFELGEKIDNPDATDLPLALAAVLLRDKNGRITINMPISGKTDDPEFSVTRIVLDAFVNLLVKIAASPFTAIGSFLDSDADFSVVTFDAGKVGINAEQGEKLQDLASALTQKPELGLEIKGMAYINQDWPAMNETALRDKIKQMKASALKKAGKTKRAEYIELSEDEYKSLLADLFIQTFPELAKRSILGNPKLIYPEMGDFYIVASNMLKGMIKPNNNKLAILAMTRAKNIARYMIKKGQIAQTRIFILDGKVQEKADNKVLDTYLSLKVQ